MWKETELASTTGERTIGRNASALLDVVNTWNQRLNFTLQDQYDSNQLTGTYKIRVRVDGKLNGRSIEPLSFDGYLICEFSSEIMESVKLVRTRDNQGNVIDDRMTLGRTPITVTTLIFEEGEPPNDSIRKRRNGYSSTLSERAIPYLSTHLR